MIWQLRTRRLNLPRRPLLMGIVNVTPDSFSDGGLFLDHAKAVEHGLRLVDEGADLLDVGGESTRPYSDPVGEAEERRRIVAVIRALARQTSVPISIDTSKASVATSALEAGAEIINDVTALTGDPQMMTVAVESRAGVCAMHMLGTPQTMQDDPQYEDVIAEVLAYLCQRRDALLSAGVERKRICLDPGIGFGKTHAHNLTLLRNCWRLHSLGCPLLVGHSRKGYIAHIIGDKQADRTAGTLGVSLSLASQGVQILRVLDIAPHRHALALFESTGGLDAPPSAWPTSLRF